MFALLIRRFLFELGDNEQTFSLFSSSSFNFLFCDLTGSPLARIVDERLDRFGVKYWVKQAWAILILYNKDVMNCSAA